MPHTHNMSVVARELGISRQAVSKLVKNRERTGFPEPGPNGWDTKVVAEWYRTFEPRRGPRAGLRKES